MQTASKKVVNGWAMYDWANSVYSLVITSTIFPAYYEAVTGDGNENTFIDKIKVGPFEFVNTALYNYALGIAFIIVAICRDRFTPGICATPTWKTAWSNRARPRCVARKSICARSTCRSTSTGRAKTTSSPSAEPTLRPSICRGKNVSSWGPRVTSRA